MPAEPYDAILLLSFGGPEKPEDVMPFLENVTRGKNVPRERLEEVAEHYYLFEGVSPINGQCRALIGALKDELRTHGPDLPIYWGNRNWHPMLADTLRRMGEDGVKRALCFATSVFGSYSGCRQYREDIERARTEVGEGAPLVDKIRTFHDHPGFIEPMAERVRDGFGALPEHLREGARLVYTAHSIPVSMSQTGPYVRQLEEASRLVAERAGRPEWDLVYQSRSGPPQIPWLEPDILDHLGALKDDGVRAVVVAPIGFISDHMEVLFDLDVEARERASELGLAFSRAHTAGIHPSFVAGIRELIQERVQGAERRSLGALGPGPDVCAPACCERARRPQAATGT